MKEEVDAAADFLSRIFLAHDNISKEKVQEFTCLLSDVLQRRFRDHWHETCPTKGQAYRCIRVCPDEHLDPLLEKVCNQVGINVNDFNIPMELTLWVDPKEVVCKFGDLKCSYHTVAKKDITSGTLDNQAEHLDIKDLVENARDLYLKKQTVVIHPINPSEMHIQSSPYGDGSSNGFTMAVRINGHTNLSCSPPNSSFDGSPRSKGKLQHSSHHKRGGFHYYGKATGGKGGFLANGHASGSHHGNGTSGGGFHRNHQQQHHHHHHHHHGPPTTAYQNGYLNSYQEENGFNGYDQRSVSPSKMNGGGNGLPPLTSLSQGSPTPEQIQQQMQHPPPIPPPMPPHLHQPFAHPPNDPSTLPPLPPAGTQHQPPLPVSSAVIASSTSAASSSISSTSSNSTTNNSNGNPGKLSNNPNQPNGSKFQPARMGGGSRGSNGRQSSPVKEIK